MSTARKTFHERLLAQVMRVDDKGTPNNADRTSLLSVAIAKEVLLRLGSALPGNVPGQSLGTRFEVLCNDYLNLAFPVLEHLRPGPWSIDRNGPPAAKGINGIAKFDQYEHLTAVTDAAKEDVVLGAAIGRDYIIKPDIMVYRQPISDDLVNSKLPIVDDQIARHTSMRAVNQSTPILHASVSCKWTMRSDRVQNARAEGLNLVRNRKGRLPHIVVVTAECLPSRIASIALGTGDIDCVYHFALPELEVAVSEYGNDDSKLLIKMMTEGKRLRDIADLPFDLLGGHGHHLTGTTQREYEANLWQGYGPRDDRPPIGPRNGIPLSSSSKEPSRETGPRFFFKTQSDICSRVFLASAHFTELPDRKRT